MSKLHYFDISTEIQMPLDIKQGYRIRGLKGAACGYMRKTTTDASNVTCKLCLREMEKSGAANEQTNR
ncbi:hypothetical protein HX773_19025 [Pantoea sp. B9002]|uniref:hypothetical protein n=1 Tax=Pantoea sp. B9002 TaxID=2726979 RepID=UPI0015A20D72|nr:hypothetical protein [Pantoea sp. B9002]NWA63002.1 hypothetical protein [Pantoea sp. B9002]